MSFFSWLQTRTSNLPARAPSPRRPAARRFRPRLEMLEDRALLTAYTAATAADLIADINAANKHGGANTITLTAPTTSPYLLTAVNNTTSGANGLPVISGKTGDNLTIIGNGDTVERSTGLSIFRLLEVAPGASLTLENLTLENGAAGQGGAILNHGELNLQGVTLQHNLAVGSSGIQNANKASAAIATDAQGGGIWSDGTIVLQNLTLPSGAVLHTILQNDNAWGGDGGTYLKNNGSLSLVAANGGQGLGGALYLAGGTTGAINATLTDVVLMNDGAYGGNGGSDINPPGYANNGGNGGAALGGAIDIAGAGTVVMNGTNGITLENNVAVGGNGGDSAALGGTGGDASGGAVYVTGGSSPVVSMDGLFFQNNLAEGGSGGYTIGVDSEDFTGSGGNAYGGAIFMGGGSANVMIGGTIIQGNEALAGAGGRGIVSGLGGGIFNASSFAVELDPFTQTYTLNNTDTNSGLNGITANIDGVWSINTGF